MVFDKRPVFGVDVTELERADGVLRRWLRLSDRCDVNVQTRIRLRLTTGGVRILLKERYGLLVVNMSWSPDVSARIRRGLLGINERLGLKTGLGLESDLCGKTSDLIRAWRTLFVTVV